MNAVTTPRTLEDWISELVATSDVDDLRSVGVRAVDAGFARAEVTCDRCQPREVFFFTGAVQHLRRSEEAYRREQAADPPSLFALHQPGDMRPARSSDARGDRPIFWSTAQCQSCDAAVVWAVTAKGRRMPVNATPDPAGNVVLVDQGISSPPLALVIHTERQQTETPVDALHTSHFQTCPNAAAHRRTRRN